MTDVERIQLKYRPNPTAALFHASKAQFRGLRGPIGTGKSVACCFELYRLAKAQEPFNNIRHTRWAIVRQTYGELMNTTLKTWQKWFPDSICPIKKSQPMTGRMVLPLPDGTTLDMELIFLALEREEDAKKVLSLELTGAWINEARELPWQLIEDLGGRIGRFPSKDVGGHTRKCLIADTNSPDDTHWWYKLAEEGRLSEDAEPVTKDAFEFFAQPPALIKTANGGYIPNPSAENVQNLTDGYRYWLDQLPGKNDRWIQIYLLGEYGAIMAGKSVYGKAYSDGTHCSQVDFEPVKKWPVVLSFDFGLTPAALFLQQTPRGQIRAIEEIVTEDCDLETLCSDMVLPRLLTRYRQCHIMVTGDPVGTTRGDQSRDKASRFDTIQKLLGQYIADWVPAATNDPEIRVAVVRRFLQRMIEGHPALIISPECKVLRKGFISHYKYRKISLPGGDHRYMETPDKNMYSHIHDALQYGLMLLGGGLPSLTPNAPRSRKRVAADAIAGV